MIKIKFLFTVLSLFIFLNVFAQKGVITGVIRDTETHERIPFATVSVFNKNADLVTGTTSNEKGKFKIEKLESGDYRLVISFIGYGADTLKTVTLSESHPAVHVGEVDLKPVTVEIEGVDIKGMARTTSKKNRPANLPCQRFRNGQRRNSS
jgi:hypothetical protein